MATEASLFCMRDPRAPLKYKFYYGVYNQYESFICLDLMVKNREILIEMYYKWWTSTKLVWVRYQNY
jgi:hypothetical protein